MGRNYYQSRLRQSENIFGSGANDPYQNMHFYNLGRGWQIYPKYWLQAFNHNSNAHSIGAGYSATDNKVILIHEHVYHK